MTQTTHSLDKLKTLNISIPLTKGYIAVIDERDGDLAMVKWTALVKKDSSVVYAYRRLPRANGKHPVQYLHRVILARMLGRELLRNELTDHVNLNGLDNRRENLRLATFAQNGLNRGVNRNNTSGYKGVCWDKRMGKWMARIWVDGKGKFLGYFDNPEGGAKAYEEAAHKYHGEFARCDFEVAS